MVHPLKKFIDDHISKDYLNFKRLKNGNFGLYTARKTKDFNCDYEAIFKAYENYQERNYRGYKFRDNLKQAIRRSYLYDVVPAHEKHWFIFRERTAEETADLKNKNKKGSKEAMDKSPQSSGYGTDENSNIPSPKSPELMDSSVMGINTENDPLQKICNEVYKKFFPPWPQFHQGEGTANDSSQELINEVNILQNTDTFNGLQQVEYGGNDPHQELVNPTAGELQWPSPFTGVQGDEYLMNNSPQKPVSDAVGTLQSADTLVGVPKGEYRGNEPPQEPVSPVAATLQSLGSFAGLRGGEYLMNNSPQGTVSGTTGNLQSTSTLIQLPQG